MGRRVSPQWHSVSEKQGLLLDISVTFNWRVVFVFFLSFNALHDTPSDVRFITHDCSTYRYSLYFAFLSG